MRLGRLDDDKPIVFDRSDIDLALRKAHKDIARAIKRGEAILSRSDIRYLVDLYYQIQENRKGADNQVRAASVAASPPEPHSLVSWIGNYSESIEALIKRALETWTDKDIASVWAKSIIGIGPVLSAGLAAHIDIAIATNPSKIWRFAGLDPTGKWTKGKKRPWNARLKVLCWKIGDSFVKVSGNRRSFYGKLYREAKERELARDNSGDNKAEAERCMKELKGMTPGMKSHYELGKLPPGRLDLRARRKVVKLFLSHWWEIAYWAHHKTKAPEPYIGAIGGHSGLIHAEEVQAMERCGGPERMADLA